MNKARTLYEDFLIETKDRHKAKACVTILIDEFEKMIGEFRKHSVEWWAYRLNEIREDLKEL